MGKLLHRQQLRRQLGLSQQPSQGFSLEDRNWLRSQGIDRPDLLPRKSVWYRADGTGSLGPSDPYHLGLYRRRGLTLLPPAPPEPKPRSSRNSQINTTSSPLKNPANPANPAGSRPIPARTARQVKNPQPNPAATRQSLKKPPLLLNTTTPRQVRQVRQV